MPMSLLNKPKPTKPQPKEKDDTIDMFLWTYSEDKQDKVREAVSKMPKSKRDKIIEKRLKDVGMWE